MVDTRALSAVASLLAVAAVVGGSPSDVTFEGSVPYALAFDIRIPVGGWFEGELDYDLRGEYGIMLYSQFDPAQRDDASLSGYDAFDHSPHASVSYGEVRVSAREEAQRSPVGGWSWRCGDPGDECPLAFTLLGAASGRVAETRYRFAGPEGMTVAMTDRVGVLSPGEFTGGVSASAGALASATVNVDATATLTFARGLFGIAFLTGDGTFTLERPDGSILDVGEVDVMPLLWDLPGTYVARADQAGSLLGPTVVWADVGRE